MNKLKTLSFLYGIITVMSMFYFTIIDDSVGAIVATCGIVSAIISCHIDDKIKKRK